MRKQMKIAAVVSAAALLAIGASFTSMAAEKGTWKLEDGEWSCYDKDGDAYEDTFCLDNGKEFYVNENGVIEGNRWVEDGDAMYYVNSAGQKIVNDWRFVTPYEDEDADEEWYYFQASGKRAEDKKLVINGKTYYFDSEGVMLTGWVSKDDNSYKKSSKGDIEGGVTVVYCNEDGSRASKLWIEEYEPGTDEEDEDEDNLHYYYIKSSGEVATKKQKNINGQTYFFGNDGVMLSGWVAKFTDSNAKEYYDIIWNNDEDTDGSYPTALGAYSNTDVYFCGDADDGHMKKNKWIKVWNNKEFGMNDDDKDEYWFFIKKDGTVYVPAAKDPDAQKYKLDDVAADEVADIFKKSGNMFAGTEYKVNGETYLFDENGQMKNGFVKMNKNFGTEEAPNVQSVMFYYGGSDDGARKTGSFSVNDENGENSKCYFATKTEDNYSYYIAAGINGAKSGKLYTDGVLVKANEDKYEKKTVEVDGKPYSFIVNKSGTIQDDTDVYKEDGEELFEGKKFTYNNEVKGATYKCITSEK